MWRLYSDRAPFLIIPRAWVGAILKSLLVCLKIQGDQTTMGCTVSRTGNMFTKCIYRHLMFTHSVTRFDLSDDRLYICAWSARSAEYGPTGYRWCRSRKFSTLRLDLLSTSKSFLEISAPPCCLCRLTCFDYALMSLPSPIHHTLFLL